MFCTKSKKEKIRSNELTQLFIHLHHQIVMKRSEKRFYIGSDGGLVYEANRAKQIAALREAEEFAASFRELLAKISL